MQFKKEFNFEQRKQEADRVILKYPDRIPIICEKSQKSKAKALDKKKYLVPCDLTIGQFVFIIRRRLAEYFMTLRKQLATKEKNSI